MSIAKLIARCMVTCSLLLCAMMTTAHADNTQPKFVLAPTSATSVRISINGTLSVSYQVTNATKVTRTLTMVPIQGITQNTAGIGACANPFVLASNQSCSLVLTLDGSTLPHGGVTSGPKICKTKRAGDNSPDLFLCSQPSPINSLNITVISTASPTLLATISTDREVGVNYSQTNVASGGVPPYTYSVFSGTLPAGTTLNTTTGTVSGMPTTAGAFSYVIKVIDSVGASATATTSGTIAPALVLTATPSANLEVGAVYSQTNMASGGRTPYRYSLSAGSLPGGTTLNITTGTVSGTLTSGGAFNYTIQVTDLDGKKATATSTGTIAATIFLKATASTATEVGAAYSQVNTVTGGIAPFTYSVSAGSLPAGTSLNTSTGTVSGTPTSGGSIYYVIQVSDHDGLKATATSTGTIAATITLTATPSTFTEIGRAYSQINTVAGGTSPYTYSVSQGTLPEGTHLDISGTVSGTPTSGGAFSYTIQVTDRNSLKATAPTVGNIASTVSITAHPSTFTEVGVAYSQSNVASGGTTPYAYSISSGALPSNTSLNTTTGLVSGTPDSGGAFYYIVQAKDAAGLKATVPVQGAIASTVQMTGTPSTLTAVGEVYSQTNVASGGTAPYTYALSSGALPTNTSLNTTTGTVSGTPTGSGQFNYTIQATDADGIKASVPTQTTISGSLHLVSTPSPHTELNTAYNQLNTVSGGTAPYAYALVNGSLPSGTTLNTTTGTVSGTPNSGGGFNYTIQVTDHSGLKASAVTQGSIAAAVQITATNSTLTAVGELYSQTNVASGGTAPYTYAVSSGTVPTNTSLNTTTGTVSGTPNGSGQFNYTIQATDAAGLKASVPTQTTISGSLQLVSTPSSQTEVNRFYNQLNTVSGGTAPYTYALINGSLPSGTTLNTTTGTVSGTPDSGGGFNYTIQVTDHAGLKASAVTQGSIASAVQITATPSTLTAVGELYSQTNVASGGTAPYAYAVSSGTLPTNTSLNTTTGTVSGTPTGSGQFNYTIQATDADGLKVSVPTQTTIAGTLHLVSTPSLRTEVGVSYSQLNTVSGGTAPYTYAVVNGSLPSGTTLNTATGTVSGTPDSGGSFNYNIQVTDSAGIIAFAQTQGSIASAVQVTPTPSANTAVGEVYTQTNVASGGTAPYTYSLFSGSLPSNTFLNTSTGTVSGTPDTSGPFIYVIQATDSIGAKASATSQGTIAGTLGLNATTSTFTQVGVSYTQLNTVIGGTSPYTYAVTTGALPAGTTLNTSGTVSGTPTTGGAFIYTITVTDHDGAKASAPTQGNIAYATLVLTATPSSTTQVNSFYSQTNVAAGGKTPYTYSVASGSSLPAGLALNTTTGTVYGTPLTAAAFSYIIQVQDTQPTTQFAPTRGTMAGNSTQTLYSTTNTDLLFSTDNGVSWTPTTGTIPANYNSGFITANGTLYVGGSNGAVYVSRDAGATWTATATNPYGSTPVEGVFVTSNGIIYATSSTAVFNSTDGGVSWSITGGVAVSGNLLKALFVNQAGIPYTGDILGGVYHYISPTWYITGTPDITHPSPILGLFIASNDTTLYAATGTSNGGVFVSTNSGTSWTETPSPDAGQPVNSIFANASGVLYAATQNNVNLSSNGGTNWTTTTSPSPGGAALTSVFLAPTILYTGIGSTINSSTNSGVTWTSSGACGNPVTSIALASDGTFYTGSEIGNVFFYSPTTNACTYTNAPGSGYAITGLFVTPITSTQPDGILYAILNVGNGSEDDVYYSTDKGNNWSSIFPAPAAPSSIFVSSSTTSTSNTAVVYIGLVTGQVMTSTGTFSPWTSLSAGIPEPNSAVQAIYLTSNQFIYVGTASGNVYVATLTGNSWTKLTQPDGTAIQGLFVAPNGTTIYATTQSGKVFVSTNTGSTWTATTTTPSGGTTPAYGMAVQY
ncbi:MAG: putative Ig domain-containing protein [Gammaproteobacteria bacterium]|nr:putative Ig domain-containing protein [Gammaproteobacteria bacterium]